MPETDSKWIEIAYSAIRVFADDGTLDLGELNFLMGLALKDGKVDEDEKRVLRNIFDKVNRRDVTSLVWSRMEEARRKHGI